MWLDLAEISTQSEDRQTDKTDSPNFAQIKPSVSSVAAAGLSTGAASTMASGLLKGMQRTVQRSVGMTQATALPRCGLLIYT